MNFLFGKKVKASSEKEDSHGEGSQRSDDDQTSAEGDGPQESEREVEAFIHASEGERKALLNGFDLLRKESLFCDATFLCHDVLFRAHKVVLSSWSRWMRTFLADSSSEEVLSLDIFTPEAFRSVLDYMYGHPLVLTVEVSDGIFCCEYHGVMLHDIGGRQRVKGCTSLRTIQVGAALLEVSDDKSGSKQLSFPARTCRQI